MRFPALRSRSRALLAVVALGGLSLGTGAATWVRTTVATALSPEVTVTASGTQAAPGLGAGGLVLLAAGVALALGGRVARYLVLAVVAAAGVLVVAAAVAVLADPVPAATAAAAGTAGVTDLTSPVVVTPWPWAAVVVGVLTVVVAALGAAGAGQWSAASGRHERAADAAPAPSEQASGPASAPAAPDAPTTADAAHRTGEAAGELDAHDAWDALSRGDDPTTR